MSIAAVGGVNPLQAFAPVARPASGEAGEVPGAPDHDGDADDSRVTPPPSTGGKVSLYA